jgi:hypothetical protein
MNAYWIYLVVVMFSKQKIPLTVWWTKHISRLSAVVMFFLQIYAISGLYIGITRISMLLVQTCHCETGVWVCNYTLYKNAEFWLVNSRDIFLQIQSLHCEFAEFLLHVGVFA